MKKQILNIIVGLGLILGSATFVGAMEEVTPSNFVEKLFEALEKKKENDKKTRVFGSAYQEYHDCQNDKKVLREAVDNCFNEKDKASVQNIVADKKEESFLQKGDVSFSKSPGTSDFQYKIEKDTQYWLDKGTKWNSARLLLLYGENVKPLKNMLSDYLRSYSIKGICSGAFTLGLASISLILLVHIIVRIFVTMHTFKALAGNKVVMGLLSKCGIDAQKFANGIAKLEEKACESKWIGKLQSTNKIYIHLEILACLGFACGAVFSTLILWPCLFRIYLLQSARNVFKENVITQKELVEQ